MIAIENDRSSSSVGMSTSAVLSREFSGEEISERLSGDDDTTLHNDIFRTKRKCSIRNRWNRWLTSGQGKVASNRLRLPVEYRRSRSRVRVNDMSGDGEQADER